MNEQFKFWLYFSVSEVKDKLVRSQLNPFCDEVFFHMSGELPTALLQQVTDFVATDIMILKHCSLKRKATLDKHRGGR